VIIKNIQVLRAFAALSVLFLHTVYAVNDYNFFQLTTNFSSWGAFGVDIFFIITGFIMIYIKRSQKNPLYFLKKRISRILPLYWFFNILYLFLFILFPTSFRTLQISYDNFFLSLFFLNQYINLRMPIISMGWTLEYEMLFYLLFAICMFVKNIKLFYFFIIFLLLLLSFLDLLFIEFLFGILIGIFYINKNKLIKKIFKNYSYFILIFGFVTLFISIFFYEETHRAIKYGIPCAFIFLGSIFSKQISSKYIIFLGNASYSIYLSHFLCVIGTVKLFKIIAPNFNGITLVLIILTFSLLFASLIYCFIERNLHLLMKKL
jgi:exopolysaccharide production protein ExoZ